MSVFIRDNLRVLYVHVPKTGGTAIEFFFEKNGFAASFVDRGGEGSIVPMMKCSPQHLHAEQLQSIFNLGRFSYSFMTVRNPVDRLLSEYRMRAVMQKSIEDVDTWIGNTLDAYPKNTFLIDNHIRPQVEFWFTGCDVYKHEAGFGESWVSRIAERLGCEFGYPEVEVAMRFPSSAKVRPNAASVARIRDFYRRDFEFFGYDLASAA
jgi:hypothetical protein